MAIAISRIGRSVPPSTYTAAGPDRIGARSTGRRLRQDGRRRHAARYGRVLRTPDRAERGHRGKSQQARRRQGKRLLNRNRRPVGHRARSEAVDRRYPGVLAARGRDAMKCVGQDRTPSFGRRGASTIGRRGRGRRLHASSSPSSDAAQSFASPVAIRALPVRFRSGGQSARPRRGSPNVERCHHFDLSPAIGFERRQTAPGYCIQGALTEASMSDRR